MGKVGRFLVPAVRCARVWTPKTWSKSHFSHFPRRHPEPRKVINPQNLALFSVIDSCHGGRAEEFVDAVHEFESWRADHEATSLWVGPSSDTPKS